MKGAAVDVEADTAHAVPPDFHRALESMMAKRAPAPPPPPPVIVPPAPPSTPPERMPARAAMISGASFAPVSRSSIAPVVTSLTPPSPAFEPVALRAPVAPMPPAPPPSAPASTPPPPPSSPVAYERAFRRWSQPSFDVVSEPVPSTEPLTFQVYTPDALPPPSRPRFASELAFTPPPEPSSGNLLVRAGAVVLGVAVMVAVAVAGLAAASDDAPKAAAAAPPAAIATVLPTVDTALPMPIVAVPPAPTVVVLPADPPAAAPAVSAAKPAKPAKKKAHADKGNLPPNPYGG